MSFHENLIQTRKLRGMTQEELAERLDISRQAISKWENGESVPDTDKLIRLGEVLDVSLDELSGKEPSTSPAAPEPVKKTGVRPLAAVVLCLLAALGGFVVGGLLRPFGSQVNASQPELPVQLTAEHVSILHNESSTTITFVSNVTLDGKVFLSRGEGLTPFSAEAKWSGGVYHVEMTAPSGEYPTLTFVVEQNGVQRSVLLASNIVFDADGGSSYTSATP